MGKVKNRVVLKTLEGKSLDEKLMVLAAGERAVSTSGLSLDALGPSLADCLKGALFPKEGRLGQFDHRTLKQIRAAYQKLFWAQLKARSAELHSGNAACLREMADEIGPRDSGISTVGLVCFLFHAASKRTPTMSEIEGLLQDMGQPMPRESIRDHLKHLELKASPGQRGRPKP